MHVLLTTDVIGGVWDFSCTLARQLRAAGQRVTLLAFGRPSLNRQAEGEACASAFFWHDLKLEWMRDSAADVQRTREVTTALVDRLHPDVVHANQFALGCASLAAPVLLTAHSDVLSWFRWTLGRDASPEWSAYTRLVQDGLRGASAVTAVTDFLAADIRSLYALARPIRTIRNGWPAPTAIPHPIADRPRLSLLAGRAWDEAKNLRLALSTAQAGSLGRVALAGPLAHPETGHKLDLPAAVEGLGVLPRAEMGRWLAQARVYLSPALYDPFGLLPLQAALAGCALLLSDIPSYRELWDGAAVFFPPNDQAALGRQWRRLLDDQPLAACLATQARRRAEERFSPKRMAAEYLAEYHGLVRTGTQPAMASAR